MVVLMTDDLEKLVTAQRAAWTKRPREIPRRRIPKETVMVTPEPECPKWVPSHHVEEWRRVALIKDEFAAAAHVRELKRREIE